MKTQCTMLIAAALFSGGNSIPAQAAVPDVRMDAVNSETSPEAAIRSIFAAFDNRNYEYLVRNHHADIHGGMSEQEIQAAIGTMRAKYQNKAVHMAMRSKFLAAMKVKPELAKEATPPAHRTGDVAIFTCPVDESDASKGSYTICLSKLGTGKWAYVF